MATKHGWVDIHGMLLMIARRGWVGVWGREKTLSSQEVIPFEIPKQRDGHR